MILNGRIVAKNIYENLSKEIQCLEVPPKLGVILVGDDNTPSLRYIQEKKRHAKKIGIDFELFHFPKNITEQTLIDEIHRLNADTSISGFMVQTPLPDHINTKNVFSEIAPQKDVDGFHPINQGKVLIGDNSGLTPCTPAGIMKLIESEGINLSGKEVVVVGKSNIVGKPLTLLLINAGATVTSCNSKTPNLSTYTKQADIVMSATGVPGIITSKNIEKDTIVIDVGFSVHNGKIVGDALYEEIESNGNLITPVPGGVGPMTVAMLMSNTLKAHKTNIGIR